MDSHLEIYEGFWTNWAHGSIMGGTLTLANQRASYLIALIALFVHLSGSSFWRLMSFVFFQMKAKRDVDDDISIQHQAILRNTHSPAASLFSFVRVWTRTRNWRRNVVWGVWAMISFLGLLAAGVLSAKVTTVGPEVLLRSKHCGRWWSFVTVGTPFMQRGPTYLDVPIYGKAINRLYITSNNYASVCRDKEDTETCTPLARQPISWSSSLQSGCPFDDSMCVSNIRFQIQAEDIYSDLHLGINSHQNDRMKLSVTKQCAVLAREGYFATYKSSNISLLTQKIKGYLSNHFEFDPGEHLDFEAFLYGQSHAADLPWPVTFLHVRPTSSYGSMTGVSGYSLESVESYQYCNGTENRFWNSGFVTFVPIAKMGQTYRQVDLLFLTSLVGYVSPVKDPWFNAEASYHTLGQPASPDQVTYFPPYSTNAMGCVGEVLLCRGHVESDRDCVLISPNGFPYKSPNRGDPDWHVVQKLLRLNPRQTAIAQRLQDAVSQTNFGQIVSTLGANSMLASQSTSTAAVFNVGLPDNQWTLEVENWFVTMLKSLVIYNAQYVTGSQVEEYNEHITPPSEEHAWMCESQVAKVTGYSSFSVLGICCILFGGSVLVVLNFFGPWVYFRFLRRYEAKRWRKVCWDESELLELQLAARKNRDVDDSVSEIMVHEASMKC